VRIDNTTTFIAKPLVVPQQTLRAFTAVVRKDILLKKASLPLQRVASIRHRLELHLQSPARYFTYDTAWSPFHEPLAPPASIT
jgi:hypothetical protein